MWSCFIIQITFVRVLRHPVDVLSPCRLRVSRAKSVRNLTLTRTDVTNPLHFHCCAKIGRLRFESTVFETGVTLGRFPALKIASPKNCTMYCDPPSSSRLDPFVVERCQRRPFVLKRRRPIRRDTKDPRCICLYIAGKSQHRCTSPTLCMRQPPTDSRMSLSRSHPVRMHPRCDRWCSY